jgi:hypothetical protein
MLLLTASDTAHSTAAVLTETDTVLLLGVMLFGVARNRFVTGRILTLQAPARVEATQAWLLQFEQQMAAAATSNSTSNSSDSTASANATAAVRMLPSIFEFVFARIDEVS